MKKNLLILVLLIFSINYIFADDCEKNTYSEIQHQKNMMVDAWNKGDVDGVASFYKTPFVYMSKDKVLTTKKEMINHYIKSFSAAKSDSLNLGQLSLNYKFCENIGDSHQIAILRYNLKLNGKTFEGDDLLMWEKVGDNYKIVVDFPR